MGYELHITRKKYYFDEEGAAITPQEWLAYVEADDELGIDKGNGEFFAVWTGDNRYGPGNAWFDWCNGNIDTKQPDELILAKMLQMAEHFGAKVQGDDGEVYVAADLETGFRHEPETPPEKQTTRSWLARWFGR